jgi:hypothetical protein
MESASTPAPRFTSERLRIVRFKLAERVNRGTLLLGKGGVAAAIKSLERADEVVVQGQTIFCL